jgi:hypothetical protein
MSGGREGQRHHAPCAGIGTRRILASNAIAAPFAHKYSTVRKKIQDIIKKRQKKGGGWRGV